MSIKEYIGPKNQISPDELSKYEDGKWVAGEKRDGHWACLKTDDNCIVQKVIAQSGTEFGSNAVRGIKGRNIGIPNSSIIGELETGTQAATKFYKSFGYRRFHMFDIHRLKGESATILSYDLRRKLVVAVGEKIFSKDPEIAKRLLIVREQTSNFLDFYKDVMAENGEGLVLKRLSSTYSSHTSDRKTDDWTKVKQDRFIDFLVMGHKLSATGIDQLDIGLLSDGAFKRIQTILCPKGFHPKDLVGKVIEVRGGEIMDSGALRHARYERVREDRAKETCVR